jgi:hypothetical protein
VATLEELKTAGMVVVRGARCPLLAVARPRRRFNVVKRSVVFIKAARL